MTQRIRPRLECGPLYHPTGGLAGIGSTSGSAICTIARSGCPSNEVRRYHASFSYQAATWDKPRRVIAKVEWHPGELYPSAGFIVTNMSRPAENVVAFYKKRGMCEQWSKEGNGAIKWT